MGLFIGVHWIHCKSINALIGCVVGGLRAIVRVAHCVRNLSGVVRSRVLYYSVGISGNARNDLVWGRQQLIENIATC